MKAPRAAHHHAYRNAAAESIVSGPHKPIAELTPGQRARRRAQNRRTQQRRRDRGRQPARRKQYANQNARHKARQRELAAEQTRKLRLGGLSLITEATLRRPTFKVRTPSGCYIETLEHDLI